MSQVLKLVSGFLSIAFVTTLALTIYYGTQICDEQPPPSFNLQKAENHLINGLTNDAKEFTYVVFTDPQLGLYDVVAGNDGTNWDHDIESINKLGVIVNELQPDFIFCTGDLNNAYPDDHFPQDGFKAAYRPPQTYDLLEAFKNAFNNEIPTFMLAGNHDLTESPKFIHVNSYEMTWGQSYYHFRYAGQIFIAIETQYFRSEEADTVQYRNDQLDWLTTIFNELPKNEIKTVFQHVPLFIETADETDSELDGKTIPQPHRAQLLELFCENNVSLVYSGHTHFTHVPNPYQCPGKTQTIQQIILTSINAQLDWMSESGQHYPTDKPENTVGKAQFLKATVNLNGDVTRSFIDL